MNTQEPSQSGVFPRFYTDAKQNTALSEEAGHPVFVDREMVEIRIAGDNKTVVVKKVTEEHKRRWPQHYEAFKKGLEDPVEGLPLRHCPLFTDAQVKTLNGNSIYTVEALAELPDSFLMRLGMGARGLQVKAKAYLKNANDTKEVTRLAAENEKMKQEMKFLRDQIRSMGVEIQAEKSEAVDVVEIPQEPEPPKTLKDLNLSSRTMTALKKNNIFEVEQLIKLTPDELVALPGVGIGAVEEITRHFA